MSQRCMRFLVAFAFVALSALPAAARDVHFIGRLALEGGGEDLVEVEYSDGSSKTVTGGGLVTFSGGLVYTPETLPIAVEALIGYKVDSVTGSNGDIKFTRLPLDLIASYRIGNFRVGGGVTYHLSPELTCNVDGMCDGSVSLDPALGGLVQFAYGRYDGGFVWDLGLRGTIINYKAPGGSFDGSCFGGFLSFGF